VAAAAEQDANRAGLMVLARLLRMAAVVSLSNLLRLSAVAVMVARSRLAKRICTREVHVDGVCGVTLHSHATPTITTPIQAQW
jgi:hypothetical protein